MKEKTLWKEVIAMYHEYRAGSLYLFMWGVVLGMLFVVLMG